MPSPKASGRPDAALDRLSFVSGSLLALALVEVVVTWALGRPDEANFGLGIAGLSSLLAAAATMLSVSDWVSNLRSERWRRRIATIVTALCGIAGSGVGIVGLGILADASRR